MKRLIIFILLLLLIPCAAQRGRTRGEDTKVDIQVLEQKVGSSASLTDDLVYFKVKITNIGEAAIVYTNNRFVLKDTDGQQHMVSRPWYPQGSTLAPKESVVVDRVYFEIPKKSKPAELSLMMRRRILSTVKL